MTREEWLNAALAQVRTYLAEQGACTVPDDARVSVGFPGGGSARKRIGECWTRATSSTGVNEMFISPVVRDPSTMVEVLVHEAIHASDDCASGHKGHFRKAATAAGLIGKMTSTVAGPELKAWITDTLAQLPAYDAGSLSLSGRQKQSTRMLKFECIGCGCVVRTSAKWSETVDNLKCGCGGFFHASV